jgi:hypothetical protein
MESAEKVPDYHNINFFGTSPFRKRLTVHEARNGEIQWDFYRGSRPYQQPAVATRKKLGVLGYWSRPQLNPFCQYLEFIIYFGFQN